ncbi:hypothetical protein ACFX2A_026838 [Malus domestica]
MIDAGVKPVSVTISSMLPLLVELEFFGVGKELHGFSATGLVRQMQPHDEIPNSVTFTNLRPAHLGSRRLGKEIHAVTDCMGSASDYVCL